MAALSQATAEPGQRTGIIVSRNEEERILVEAGTIEVMPGWRFLLELPGRALAFKFFSVWRFLSRLYDQLQIPRRASG